MEIANLTPAERRVWWAFPRGETVDFRQGPGDGPEDGGSWGPERTVRAEVLRTLLLGGAAADGHVAALRVEGARITGTLDLRYGEVAWAVRLAHCRFEESPRLYGARTRHLTLSGSVLPGLSAATAQVDGMLRLTDCRFDAALSLGGARVSGAVFLDGARVTGPPGETALRLDRMTVEGDLWARNLVVAGGVWMAGTTVNGQITLDDADLRGDGDALDAESLTVGSALYANRLRCAGRLNLRGATVPGQLVLAEARLSNPGGLALRASSATIGELWLRDAAPIRGAVNLRRSQLGLLHILPDVWPDSVALEGLTFGALLPRLPAKPRVAVLERDEAGYVPHSYEQLAAAYLAVGDDKAARNVQLAKQRRRRGTLRLYGKVWGHLQDYAVGYGFRPMRAAGWLVALMLVGSLAYRARPPQPLKPGEAPPFNPPFYTLDLLLPIIDFGQEKAFKPTGAYQWLAYTLILAGWVLATTIVAGVTRAVSRS
ncbi:membrane-associated oxidoreductase [Actinomadura kijaniata]|uniref:membrane-associated oxidoreductase n=1 Tax=Actinomadura kijaniata TaxID=46161 RepID=UPI000836390E|nr:membrane-associated oxidoreductase [Actinomadura kijaniata]